jgi:hypothetical protein
LIWNRIIKAYLEVDDAGDVDYVRLNTTTLFVVKKM